MDERQSDTERAVRPRRRLRRTARVSVWLIASLLFLFLVAGFGVLALSGKPLRLPVWAVAEAEARLNARMPLPDLSISIETVEVMVDSGWVPRLRLENLSINRKSGGALLRLPEARVAFDAPSLMRGAVRPSSVVIAGATVRLRRDAQGRFDLDLGGGAPLRDLGAFPDLLDRVDAVFSRPELATLQEVTVEALSLTLDDQRARRVWQIGDGQLVLVNAPQEVQARLGFMLDSAGREPARALLSVATRKDSSGARLRATVEGVEARDIAAQAPVLGFLAALDAPISGKLTTGLAPDGHVSVVEGALSVAAGAVQPSPEARPIPFDAAQIALKFDPETERIALTSLEVQSRSLRLKATGHVDAPGVNIVRPEAFLAQIAFSEVMVDPEGLFTEPVRFGQGALDMRLRLDPFRIDVGQFTLQEEGRRIEARGTAEADARGWRLAVDLALNEIAHDRLLALWPVSAVPKTRSWLAENVQEGLLRDVKAALRLEQGGEPRFSLGYDFSDADVRFIKTLPPIRNGSGYATIEGQSYTMVLDAGQITPPKGGSIDMAGSVFSVLDILKKPAQAEIRLKTKSSLTAALSLLDEKPFNFLSKAGRPVELGDGRAEVSAVLRLPLVKKVLPQDVSYRVEGVLRDVRSEVLVPGRVLTADQLALLATPAGLEISGPGAIGAVPFEATYRLPFGKEAQGRSEVSGTVELSPRAIDEFRIALPKGAVKGAGQGQFTLDLPKGAPAVLTLTSNLSGLDLTVPQILWRKGAGTGGTLELTARLGKPVAVERLRIAAPGLLAEGRVTLREDGQLERVSLSRAEVADWFKGPIDLIGRGKGRAVGLEVRGGTLDLRRLPEGMGGGAAGAEDGGPITARLERVQITESIALTGLRGTFATRGGFNGSFEAALNGQAPLRGTLVPSRAGTAARITSGDAGGVLAAAGIFSKARGGILDLQLVPLGPRGHYRGTARAEAFRVRNAPVLAELLSAISVVGILEQMNGSGLVFTEGDAQFTLSPAGVEIQRGAAVGLSMGVSMAGTYDARSKRLNLQGVISPIYLLNGIGAALTRRGEGLFGFNYTIGGTSDRPDVGVNPLSILTPGMFREIFRRPVPRLQEQG